MTDFDEWFESGDTVQYEIKEHRAKFAACWNAAHEAATRQQAASIEELEAQLTQMCAALKLADEALQMFGEHAPHCNLEPCDCGLLDAHIALAPFLKGEKS